MGILLQLWTSTMAQHPLASKTAWICLQTQDFCILVGTVAFLGIGILKHTFYMGPTITLLPKKHSWDWGLRWWPYTTAIWEPSYASLVCCAAALWAYQRGPIGVLHLIRLGVSRYPWWLLVIHWLQGPWIHIIKHPLLEWRVDIPNQILHFISSCLLTDLV